METKNFIIAAGLVLSSVATFANNAFNAESTTLKSNEVIRMDKRMDAGIFDQAVAVRMDKRMDMRMDVPRMDVPSQSVVLDVQKAQLMASII